MAGWVRGLFPTAGVYPAEVGGRGLKSVGPPEDSRQKAGSRRHRIGKSAAAEATLSNQNHHATDSTNGGLRYQLQ
jgi:hypothetical protein